MPNSRPRKPRSSPSRPVPGPALAPRSVGHARRLVATQLDSWQLPQLADDARLVVSELLTNAALHAKPPIRLSLLRIPDGVRIEVSDGSSEMPMVLRPASDTMTGRGWSLVQALSDALDQGVAR